MNLHRTALYKNCLMKIFSCLLLLFEKNIFLYQGLPRPVGGGIEIMVLLKELFF